MIRVLQPSPVIDKVEMLRPAGGVREEEGVAGEEDLTNCMHIPHDALECV